MTPADSVRRLEMQNFRYRSFVLTNASERPDWHYSLAPTSIEMEGTIFPPPIPPDSPFIQALGTPAALKAPPQTDTLAQRALEEWERTLCENKAVAILAEIQAGRPTIIHKDGGEMLIAIILDKLLEEAKKLVDDPAAFTREMTRILRDKHTHPLIAQMMKPAESSEPPSATASVSGASSSRDLRTTPHEQFQ